MRNKPEADEDAAKTSMRRSTRTCRRAGVRWLCCLCVKGRDQGKRHRRVVPLLQRSKPRPFLTLH